MNQILANNVRLIRQQKNWTQQHLADVAGIQLRTLQRVESAQGASAETLAALASGLDLSVDLLRVDLDVAIEQAKALEAKVRETHNIIPLTRVECSADLATIAGSDANLMQCHSKDDAAQDAFASLKANIADMIDIWEDVGAVTHREWMREAFSQVEVLRALGCAVCVGKGATTFRGVRFQTLYLMVWPKADARDWIAVEKVMD